MAVIRGDVCHLPTGKLAGQRIVFDPAGAMFLPAARLLVVSDLHFEKGSHFGRKGIFLPPYDTRATLTALEAVVARYRPKTILSLGDAFHDKGAEGRMDPADAARLAALCAHADWIWILGNHDPLPPKRFAGAVHQRAEVAGLLFTHEPGDCDGWQVAGHLHPCALVKRDGRRVRRRCFATDGARLIMPAFGAYTGGLNVKDPAVRAAFPGDFATYMMGQTRVYHIPGGALYPDVGAQRGAVRTLPRLSADTGSRSGSA